MTVDDLRGLARVADRSPRESPVEDTAEPADGDAAADQWAARFLIPLDALADALRWATCPDEAAEELWVTRHTLDVRLATLDTTEKIFLDQLLHHTAI